MLSTNAGDLRQVADDILNFVNLWHKGELARLWESAHDITLSTRLRQLAIRLWPAIVLVIMGLGIPLLPAFEGSEQAAQSVRITLIAAAVVALASGGISVSERVNAALDKSLPIEKDPR